MNTNKKSNVVDAPKKAGEDQLEIKNYINALVNFLKNADTPMTIALQGEWGSGKTSLMNDLSYELCTNGDYYSVWINTWHYAILNSDQSMIIGILKSIIYQLNDKKDNNNKEITAALKSLGKFFVMATSNVAGQIIGLPEVGSQTYEAVKSCKDGKNIIDLPATPIIEELQREIKNLIKKRISDSKKGFIFFIDDLDRITPKIAVMILELLKNLFDFEHCIFILAIDYDVVVKGLEYKFGRLTTANEREFRSFFDKIIQLPFQMPVNAYKISSLLITSLVEVGYLTKEECNDADLKDKLVKIVELSIGHNPRSLKRLINILSLQKYLMVANGYQIRDKIVGFIVVCLQISYPVIYNILNENKDFTQWDHETFNLPENENCENNKWQYYLEKFCRKDVYLSSNANKIIELLEEIPLTDGVYDTISEAFNLSSYTNYSVDNVQSNIFDNIHIGSILKTHKSKLLSHYQENSFQNLKKVDFMCNSQRISTKVWYNLCIFAIEIHAYVLENKLALEVKIPLGYISQRVQEDYIRFKSNFEKWARDCHCKKYSCSNDLNQHCGVSLLWEYTTVEECYKDENIQKLLILLEEISGEFLLLNKKFYEFFQKIQSACKEKFNLWLYRNTTMVMDYKNKINNYQFSLDIFSESCFNAHNENTTVAVWLRNNNDRELLKDVIGKLRLNSRGYYDSMRYYIDYSKFDDLIADVQNISNNLDNF